MADCNKCIHIDVCGKLMFFGRNCNKECIHYKDGSDLVEVLYGRWKVREPDRRGYALDFICSNCNGTVYMDYARTECEYDFCPICGAKMDGDGDGT